MVNNFTIIIEQDEFLGSHYTVTINGFSIKGINDRNCIRYDYVTEESAVDARITLEDVWETEHGIEKAVFFIESLMLVFSTMEANNLPIYADYRIRLTTECRKKQLKTSEFIRVKKESLELWKVCLIWQMLCLILAIVGVAILFSFIFSSWYVILATLPVSLIVWKIFSQKKKEMLGILTKYLQN